MAKGRSPYRSAAFTTTQNSLKSRRQSEIETSREFLKRLDNLLRQDLPDDTQTEKLVKLRRELNTHLGLLHRGEKTPIVNSRQILCETLTEIKMLQAAPDAVKSFISKSATGFLEFLEFIKVQ